MRTTALFAFALLFAGSAAATAIDLDEMVAAMSRQASLEFPLRADLEITVDSLEGEPKTFGGVMWKRPSAGDGLPETLLAIPDAGLRYLIRPDGRAWVSEGGEVSAAALDTPIAGSRWVVEDLLPFSEGICEIRRAVSTLRGRLSFLCEEKEPGQYILTVYKVDVKKKIAKRVMRYQERQDNLVEMQRNEDFQEIDGKWRPGRMEMQHFELRTRDVITAKWSKAKDLPAAAFEPKTFATAPLK